MRIVGVKGSGEVHIVLSIVESRKLIVDHGEAELVIPEVDDTIGCIEAIQAARLVAMS